MLFKVPEVRHNPIRRYFCLIYTMVLLCDRTDLRLECYFEQQGSGGSGNGCPLHQVNKSGANRRMNF